MAQSMGRSVMETNPHIDRLIVYDPKEPWQMIQQTRSEKYDAVLDFMNNPRSTALTFLSGATQKVGWKQGMRWIFYNLAVPNPETPEYVPVRKLRMTRFWLEQGGLNAPPPTRIRPELFLSPEDEQKAQQWMREENLSGKDFVVMAPASRRPARIWTKEGYLNTALFIKRNFNKRVYLAWGPGEEDWVNEVRRQHEFEIPLLPPTRLREMAAIIKQSALALTNDAGPMHLAVAVDTPTVTLYGPTRPIDWNPSLTDHGTKNIVVQESDLKNLKEQRVFEACEEILGEKR